MKIAYWTKLRPRAEDWRNVLAEYDAVVYEVGGDPLTDPLREALLDWPGLLVLDGDDLEGFFADDPGRRARVLDCATAVVVRSRDLERRLRVEHPWTEIVLVEAAGDAASFAESCQVALARGRGPARHWLESLLETAAAEIPGFFPGDRASPWRAEVEELVTLRQTGANVSKRTTRSPG